MKFAAILVLAAWLSACASPPSGREPRSVETRGAELAQVQCGACHATGRVGESPAPEAPPFRTLSRNYRVDTLEEALAEGISVGHPAMPEFIFEPADVEALIVYLQSIQEDDSPS